MQNDIMGRETTQPGLPVISQAQRPLMRLLIIEDDRDATDYLVKAFREVGHVADQASDGEEGQALAFEGQYDVLIIDRMLPKRDGLSIVAALRAKSIETPVLILSALGQVDDRIKGLRAGGADYLPNPIRSPSCWRGSGSGCARTPTRTASHRGTQTPPARSCGPET